MPYKVVSSSTLAENHGETAETVSDYMETGLNALEDDGWTLVAVIPQFTEWFSDERDISRPPMLVFHKPEDKKKSGGVYFQ